MLVGGDLRYHVIMTGRRSPITQMIKDMEAGDARAADRLLEAVYDELRALAGARLRRERPGQTLIATALVHKAYLRLLGNEASSTRAGQDRKAH